MALCGNFAAIIGSENAIKARLPKLSVEALYCACSKHRKLDQGVCGSSLMVVLVEWRVLIALFAKWLGKRVVKEDPWDAKNSSSKCMKEIFLIRVSKKTVIRRQGSWIGPERIP